MAANGPVCAAVSRKHPSIKYLGDSRAGCENANSYGAVTKCDAERKEMKKRKQVVFRSGPVARVPAVQD